jgi:Tfp pilus assembly protein PilO
VVLDWLGLTFGELFVVLFLASLIVSAGYWPKLGSWVAQRLTGRKRETTLKHADK